MDPTVLLAEAAPTTPWGLLIAAVSAAVQQLLQAFGDPLYGWAFPMYAQALSGEAAPGTTANSSLVNGTTQSRAKAAIHKKLVMAMWGFMLASVAIGFLTWGTPSILGVVLPSVNGAAQMKPVGLAEVLILGAVAGLGGEITNSIVKALEAGKNLAQSRDDAQKQALEEQKKAALAEQTAAEAARSIKANAEIAIVPTSLSAKVGQAVGFSVPDPNQIEWTIPDGSAVIQDPADGRFTARRAGTFDIIARSKTDRTKTVSLKIVAVD